jgi:rsbT co-antagonist protein RsbR
VMLISSGIFLLGLITILLLPAVLPILAIAPITAVSVALLYTEGRSLYRLCVVAVLISLVITVLSQFVVLFDAPPPFMVTLVLISMVPAGTGLTLLLLGQFHHRLTETLAQTQAANEALRDAQANLEAQVAERTAALQVALEEVQARAAEQERLLVENAEQRSTIYELSVPVLPISAHTLVMPLVGALDTMRLRQVQERALQAIERSSARFLVLDITGVPIVDSQVAQGLLATIQAARLLGAEVSLVGIRPEVAQAIVGLGLDLGEVRTSSDLRMALGKFIVR